MADQFGGVPVDRFGGEKVDTGRVNQGLGRFGAATVAAGRGMTTLARGVGLVEPEKASVKTAYNDLKEKYPLSTGVGEVVGEATPFLVPGVGISAIPQQGARIAASGLLGALEGGLISRGSGGNSTDVAATAGVSGLFAGGLEAVSPLLGRLGGAIYRRAFNVEPKNNLFRGGAPSPEFQAALDKIGIAIEDLQGSTVSDLTARPGNVDPEIAARFANFQQLGIPATRGNVTQDFAQQAQEERLLSSASSQGAEPLRQVALDQSDKFQLAVNSYVDSLGVPDEVGKSVKDALSGRLDNLKGQKNALYKQVAESVSEVADIPIFTDSISGSLPSPAEIRRLSRIQGNNIPAVQDLLVEFGIDSTPEAVEAFTKSGGEILPLNVGNFEEFRQALNQLYDDRTPGGRATNSIIEKIKTALDGEVDVMLEGEDIPDALRQARSLVTQTKQEFSPQSITGRLINSKPDGVTPVIEASRVYDSILSKTAPIENLQRTIQSLQQSGEQGRQAILNLQAATVMRALDNALKAPSRKTSGVQTVGYSQFVKSLNDVGEDRLKILFASNPSGLTRLTSIKSAAENLTPAAGATPRGSAPVILDLVNRLGSSPGVAAVADAVKFVLKAGSDERSVRRALESRPQIQRVLTDVSNDFPAVSAALGIAWLSGVEDE